MKYGQSFAEQLIADGKFEEAVAAADQAIALDGHDPGGYADRALALYYLDEFEASVHDYERACELSKQGQGDLDDDILDDSYFEALRAQAVAVFEGGDGARARALLDGYPKHAPTGRHASDRTKWYELFAGQRAKVVQREAL
jgi:tetratricopeptide (TPR) repeat protein